jgi:putative ABC transport system substrate-binding protein
MPLPTHFLQLPETVWTALIMAGVMLFDERERFGAAALAHKMPTVTGIAEAVPSGVLMSYGPDYLDYVRKSAVYADKILKGAKPAPSMTSQRIPRTKNVGE